MATDVLQVRDLAKNFGAVKALQSVNLSVGKGEVVALLGDNGAGKSTLMNIICGSDTSDGGDIRVNGEPLDSLTAAHRLGVGVVYQDLALSPHLTVAANFFLGNEQKRRLGPFKMLDRRVMATEARVAIERLGISTLRDVTVPVAQLSGGQRQVLAVARAMKWATNLILLDEPTAALGPKQVEIVLDVIRAASMEGIGVILVSHDIPNVLRLAHRVVILRHGTVVLDREPEGMTVAEVMTAMVGEE